MSSNAEKLRREAAHEERVLRQMQVLGQARWVKLQRIRQQLRAIGDDKPSAETTTLRIRR